MRSRHRHVCRSYRRVDISQDLLMLRFARSVAIALAVIVLVGGLTQYFSLKPEKFGRVRINFRQDEQQLLATFTRTDALHEMPHDLYQLRALAENPQGLSAAVLKSYAFN
jgi:type VI protein secretion system component VasK